MTSDQKAVAIGAASGIVTMILSLWLLYAMLPTSDAFSLADRLAFALKWDAVAALPLVVMLAAVGNARFLSEAIDPTLGQGRCEDADQQPCHRQYAAAIYAVPGGLAGLGGGSGGAESEDRRRRRDYFRRDADCLLDWLPHQAGPPRFRVRLDLLHEFGPVGRSALAGVPLGPCPYSFSMTVAELPGLPERSDCGVTMTMLPGLSAVPTAWRKSHGASNRSPSPGETCIPPPDPEN